MADQIKISGLPEKTTIAETDYLVGNVGTSDDATGRITIDALRVRLNTANQDVTGDIESSGNIKAATLEGNGALITGVIAAGTGGASSTGSLTVACNSDNSTPAAKITLSKYTTDLVDVDETGVSPKTGIPYSHDDAAIPFDKDVDLQNNYLLRSQTIQDLQPFPAVVFDGNGNILVPDNDDLDFGAQDFSIVGWVKLGTAVPVSEYVTNKGTGSTRYATFFSSGGKFNARIGSAICESNTAINDGKWHGYVALFDRDGVISMYIDGILQANTVASPVGDISSSSNLYFGQFDDGTSRYTGAAGSHLFINRLLSDDEAKALSSNPMKAIDYADEGGSNVAQNVSSFVNLSYDTLSGATPTGFTAIKTTTSGNQLAGSQDEIDVVKGHMARLVVNIALISGSPPSVTLRTALGAGGTITEEDEITLSAGLNIVEVTASATTTGVWNFKNSDGETTNYTASDISSTTLGATAVYKGQDLVVDSDGNVLFAKDSSGNGNHGAGTNVKGSNLSESRDQREATLVAGLSAGSGTITLDPAVSDLSQVKSGGRVDIFGTISVSGISAPSGTLRLTGLEFACRDRTDLSERSSFNITTNNLGLAKTGDLRAFIVAGEKAIRIVQNVNETSGPTDDFAGNIGASTSLTISGFYYTDE